MQTDLESVSLSGFSLCRSNLYNSDAAQAEAVEAPSGVFLSISHERSPIRYNLNKLLTKVATSVTPARNSTTPSDPLSFLLVYKWKIKGGRCVHARCVQERVHTGSSVQHLLHQPKAARLLRSGSRYPMTSKALLPLQSVEACQNHHIPFPVLRTENISPKPSSNTCQESHNSKSLTLV